MGFVSPPPHLITKTTNLVPCTGKIRNKMCFHQKLDLRFKEENQNVLGKRETQKVTHADQKTA